MACAAATGAGKPPDSSARHVTGGAWSAEAKGGPAGCWEQNRRAAWTSVGWLDPRGLMLGQRTKPAGLHTARSCELGASRRGLPPDKSSPRLPALPAGPTGAP